jgi:hypothetical protein
VGVNRVPPGFARPGRDSDTSLLDRAAPANPVDDPTRRTGRGLGGPLACRTPAPVLCRPVSGLDEKRQLSGEAAIERPISSPTPERQAFPQGFRQVSRQLAVGRVIGVEERL